MPKEVNRIVTEPAVAVGKPIVRGARIAVETVIGLLAEGWREDDLIAEYPGLTHADVTACLAYARDALRSERVYPVHA